MLVISWWSLTALQISLSTVFAGYILISSTKVIINIDITLLIY